MIGMCYHADMETPETPPFVILEPGTDHPPTDLVGALAGFCHEVSRRGWEWPYETYLAIHQFMRRDPRSAPPYSE